MSRKYFEQSNGTEYWLVSIPSEPSVQEVFNKLNKFTNALSINSKFPVPNLKIGTLDQLFELSDTYVKEDTFIESVIRHLVSILIHIIKEEDTGKHFEENLKVDHEPINTFLKSFHWNEAKYNSTLAMKRILEKIHDQVLQIDTDLKRKWEEFKKIQNQILMNERRKNFNLIKKDLSPFAHDEYLTHDSHFMTTVYVVVPTNKVNDWNTKYETLSPQIVPRTSHLLKEEIDYCLFSVTILHHHHEKDSEEPPPEIKEFILIGLEHNFYVRLYDDDEISRKNKEREEIRLLAHFDKQKSLILRWLRINFSELFIAWLHLKTLRIFTESVLRYSLPANFQAILMQPMSPKSKGKLEQVMNTLFGHLDSDNAKEKKLDNIPGINMAQLHDYNPYVCLKFNVEFG